MISANESRCQFWCQLVLPGLALACPALRGGQFRKSALIQGFFVVERYDARPFACLQNGLVGINSEVSYRLDHAPILRVAQQIYTNPRRALRRFFELALQR